MGLVLSILVVTSLNFPPPDGQTGTHVRKRTRTREQLGPQTQAWGPLIRQNPRLLNKPLTSPHSLWRGVRNPPPSVLLGIRLLSHLHHPGDAAAGGEGGSGL